MRRIPALQPIVDHPTAVLVLDGVVQHRALRHSGLTLPDLEAALRSHGVGDVGDVAVAVFGTRHGVSVLTSSGDAPLWRPVVRPDPSARR